MLWPSQLLLMAACVCVWGGWQGEIVREIKSHTQGSDNGLFLSAVSVSADGKLRAANDMLMCLTSRRARMKRTGGGRGRKDGRVRGGEWGSYGGANGNESNRKMEKNPSLVATRQRLFLHVPNVLFPPWSCRCHPDTPKQPPHPPAILVTIQGSTPHSHSYWWRVARLSSFCSHDSTMFHIRMNAAVIIQNFGVPDKETVLIGIKEYKSCFIVSVSVWDEFSTCRNMMHTGL